MEKLLITNIKMTSQKHVKYLIATAVVVVVLAMASIFVQDVSAEKQNELKNTTEATQ